MYVIQLHGRRRAIGRVVSHTFRHFLESLKFKYLITCQKGWGETGCTKSKESLMRRWMTSSLHRRQKQDEGTEIQQVQKDIWQ